MSNKPFGLSIAITAKDEREYLNRLLNRLYSFDYGDIMVEIVVQLDSSYSKWQGIEDNLVRIRAINTMENITVPDLTVVNFPFAGDFSAMKNNLNSQCKYAWIFQLDADEYPSDALLASVLHLITYGNSDDQVEAVAIARLNRVVGLTKEHAQKWGWNLTHAATVVGHPPLLNEAIEPDEFAPWAKRYAELYSENGATALLGSTYHLFVDSLLVNWPDFQTRLYRNQEHIKWANKVHERLTTDKLLALTDDVKLGCYIVHDKDITRQEKQNALYEQL